MVDTNAVLAAELREISADAAHDGLGGRIWEVCLRAADRIEMMNGTRKILRDKITELAARVDELEHHLYHDHGCHHDV